MDTMSRQPRLARTEPRLLLVCNTLRSYNSVGTPLSLARPVFCSIRRRLETTVYSGF